MTDEHKKRQNLPFAANEGDRTVERLEKAKELLAEGNTTGAKALMTKSINRTKSATKAVRSVDGILKRERGKT